ncbi:unnamed protein product [Mortierella alpina]
MGGVLFSLDEEPKEFNEDMYIAMRNRIFELEAKTVNYAPFNRSRKRPVDIMDDYPIHPHSHHGQGPPTGYHGSHRYGHEDEEGGHYSKRTAYQQPPHPHHPHHGPANHGPPHDSYVYRPVPSFPSWYTPETYLASSHPHPHAQGSHVRERNSRPQDREREKPREVKAQPGASHERSPFSRRNSPPSNNNAPSQTSSPPGPQASSSTSSSPSTQRSQPVQPLAIQPRPIQPQSSGENATQSSFHAHTPHANRHSPTSHPSRQYTQAQQEQQPPSSAATQAAHAAAVAAAAAAAQQERQSFHQRQHRAQQRAQSDYSRSYHLQKHMRMMDQQRAAQLAQQKQQQEEQQQLQQQQSFKIQRHYQPHQRMYPHPSASQSTQAQQQQPQPQPPPQPQQQQQALRGAAFHQQQQQAAQQQLIQRYREQQRQLQQKKQQQQVRQLQYLRQRTAAAQAAASVSVFTTPQSASAMGHGNSGAPIADKVDRQTRPKPTRPLECSNCMALDSLTWRPKIENPPSSSSSSSSPSCASAPDTHASEGSTPTTEGKLLCPACMQYWQAHGRCRPVPPYRTNFLKKIHCRFKKELQEVRFQGWQDAQVIEFDDKMSEREFHAVFKVLPREDSLGMRSRQTSVSSHHNHSGAPTAASSPVLRSASTTAASGVTDAPVARSAGATTTVAPAESAEGPVVIKIEDNDDEGVAASLSGTASAHASAKGDEDELAFQSETAVGDLFGHRWKTEPMVGYTLVHFGGSDRTRMVPMNPTVPSLTVTFSAATESVTFTFRVLVNGLCLLSSGGGPPALHMPEMADDEPSEGEEEEEEQALRADAATESQEDEGDQPMEEPSHHGESTEGPTATTMDVDVPISV